VLGRRASAFSRYRVARQMEAQGAGVGAKGGPRVVHGEPVAGGSGGRVVASAGGGAAGYQLPAALQTLRYAALHAPQGSPQPAPLLHQDGPGAPLLPCSLALFLYPLWQHGISWFADILNPETQALKAL